MSEILESIRNQGDYEDEFLYQLSCKLSRRQQAAIEAVTGLGGRNKSDAVRLLIDLGWEAIENDGIFENVIFKKHNIEEVYRTAEESFED
ncbi:TPA: hypothetical protein ACE8RR_002117 [Neisseria gonorrhoeae]|jgi:hypothetical protein